MAKVSLDVKISCHNSVIKGTGAKSSEGHPWRNWKITLVAMKGDKEVKGKLSMILDQVVYILHPTFKDPRRAKREEPYILEEQGWGEFDMRVVLYFADKLADPRVLTFDLNFAQSNYSITHTVDFPDASPELVKLLATDPATAAAARSKGGKKPSASSKSKSKSNNSDSSSRQASKKKPLSSSPHAKTAKKAKPETIKKSFSPPPQSPLSNDLSSAPNSIPSSSPNSHKTTTAESTSSSPPANNNNMIEDNAVHIYTMSDVYNLDSIHRAKLDYDTRHRWGVPEINMMELAKRMYRMTPEQCQEFQNIILSNQPNDMRIMTEEDGGVGIDLYSLGTTLLEKLWDYSADMASDDNQSYTSQDPHASDLELDSDLELGEYNSEEESDYNRYGSGAYEPTNYREISEFHYTPDHNIAVNPGADEPGFHFSDSDTDHNHRMTNGYHTNNGYHDTSDMDIQDDDDY